MAERGTLRGIARRGQQYGTGSGVDADLLDGQSGAFYQARANHTGTQDHNGTLSGLQGGGATERYHLSASEHTSLTGTTNSTLHFHQSDRDYADAAVAALAAGFKRGEMYNFNTPTTITVSSAGAWTSISTGFTTGSNEGVTFQNASELKIVTAGTYKAEWTLSLDAASAAVEVEAGVMVNGAIQEKTVNHHYFGTANDTATLSGHGWLSLIVDDVVTAAVNNNTSATDIVMNHGNVMLSRWPQ